MDALAAIGQRNAPVITCNPPGEFRPPSDVADAFGFVADAGKVLTREKARVGPVAAPKPAGLRS